MSLTSELEQQLWELVYELLSEPEAAALRQRISSEPELARAYAEVKLQTEIVGQAAKSDLPAPVLQRPPQETDSVVLLDPIAAVSPGQSEFPAAPRPAAPRTTAAWPAAPRAANWLLGLAATLLVGLLGYSTFEVQFRANAPAVSARAAAGERLHTIVWGAPRVPSKQAGDLLVLTQTEQGQPRSEELRCRLYVGDAAAPVVDQLATTDRMGLTQIRLPVLPVSSPARLELTHVGREAAPLRAALAMGPDPLTTVLALDRAAYQPGDPLWYRSLTLTPFAQPLTDEVALEFSLHDPQGAPLPAATSYVVSEHGVAQGRLTVPVGTDDEAVPTAVGGQYALTARSPSGQYPPVQLSFQVDASGASPAVVEPAIAEPAAGRLVVDFYPESGSLVSGVLNRVYFTARDAAGAAAVLRGQVVDRSGKPVVSVQSGATGRGLFAFTPRVHESYRLKVEAPEGQRTSYPLPASPVDQFITVAAVPGVLAAGDPLCLEFRSTQAACAVAVVARCRGVTVGQTLLSSQSFAGVKTEVSVCRLNLPLDERADGVIAVTLYDLTVRPVQPVAERLVFRRPAQQLHIQVMPSAAPAEKAGEVELAVVVQDEQQRPQAAILGISIVAGGAVDQAADHLPSMATQYWLTSSLDAAAIPNADDYLRDDPESAAALDLLLGAQRPTWSLVSPSARLAQAGPPAASDDQPTSTRRAAIEGAAAGLVCLGEQVAQVTGLSARELAAAQAARELQRQQLGRTLFLSSLVVLIGLVAVGLLRLTAGVRIWAPVLSAATVCLLVGGLWMGRSGGLPATTETAETQLAKVDFSRLSPGSAASAPAEASPAADTAVEETRPAEVAKRSAPELSPDLAYSDKDRSATTPSDYGTTASPPAASRDKRSDQMLADQPAKPGADAALFGAAPPPALAAQPPAGAPTAEPLAAPAAPATAAPARPAMPAAPALAMNEPRPESASSTGAPEGRTAMAARHSLDRADAGRTPGPNSPVDHLADSARLGKSDDVANGLELAGKAETAKSKAADPLAKGLDSGGMGEGMGGMGGGMGGMSGGPSRMGGGPGGISDGMASGLRSEPKTLLPEAEKLAERKAARGASARADVQPRARMVGPGEAADAKKQVVADALAAKEQTAEAVEKQLQMPAADRPLAETPAPTVSDMAPGVDFVERANEPLLWEPQLPTDAAGRARLRFSLPANVSNYRVTIDARAPGRLGHVQQDLNAKSDQTEQAP